MTHYHDLTIDEALADPMIRLVMTADRVDPQALAIDLRDAAARIARDRRAGLASGAANGRGGGARSGAAKAALSDCCQNLAPAPAILPPFAASRRNICGAPCSW